MTGDCAPLQVAVTNRSGSTSCVGDQVTYTCTLNENSHEWEIPSIGLDETITRSEPTFPRNGDPPSPLSIVYISY